MSDPYHSPYLGPIRSVFGCGSKFSFPEPQEPPGPRLAGRRGWNPNAATPSCADTVSGPLCPRINMKALPVTESGSRYADRRQCGKCLL